MTLLEIVDKERDVLSEYVIARFYTKRLVFGKEIEALFEMCQVHRDTLRIDFIDHDADYYKNLQIVSYCIKVDDEGTSLKLYVS